MSWRDQAIALAATSDLARYDWPGRGQAPIGYIKGMAVAFGNACERFKAGDEATLVMASANSGNDLKDALSWYNSRFAALGMNNSVAGIDTLRHLFVLQVGLGMRESSGQYFCGRDRSANNTTSDTAEAGLFQQSWDSHTASPLLTKIFQKWSVSASDGLLPIFREGVTPNSRDLENFGSGDGLKFQQMCKTFPEFAVEEAGVGVRSLRTAWGPINRREVTLTASADKLFKQVQDVVLGVHPVPERINPPHDASWPPAPVFPPLVSNDDRAKIFGRFAYVSAPQSDNPEAIRITDGWDKQNIVFVPIPQMEKLGLGKGMSFHRLGAAQLQQMWKLWEDAGLLGRVKEFDGSYAPRFVRGSRSSLSNHAFGCAFDINYNHNELGATPALAGDPGSVRELVPIANQCGFFWGGHYGGRKDGMHFELTKVDGGAHVDVMDLAWAQATLNKLGQMPPLLVDGVTGPKTQAALKAFQTREGITADGTFGPQTQAALEKHVANPTPAPSENPLAGRPYHYLIGTDGNLAGTDGASTEPGYDATVPPVKGTGVAYGNLFDEKNTGRYGPYLHSSDTAEEYKEGQIDPSGPGWNANLTDQLKRRKAEGWGFIEWDNPDAYSSEDVLGAVALAESYGLGVVAKNAKLCQRPVAYLAHRNVFAHVVEAGAGSPAEVHALRVAAGKPLLPTILVFFGAKAPAQQAAAQVKAGNYQEIRVTWSATGEYGSFEEII